MKTPPAVLALLLLLVPHCTWHAVLGQTVDLGSSSFDERLQGPLLGLDTIFDSVFRLVPDAQREEFVAQVETTSAAINDIIVDACDSESPAADSSDAAQQIGEAVQGLVSSFLPEGTPDLFEMETVYAAVNFDELCPLLSSCDGQECETVVFEDIVNGDDVSLPTWEPTILDDTRPTEVPVITPDTTTTPTTTVTVFPGNGGEGCIGGSCPTPAEQEDYDSDAWGCPNDDEAEAELKAACSNLNLTTLAAVKAGEAPASLLLTASAVSIANVCGVDACLTAFQASRCFSAKISGMASLVCSCHAALDDTCQAPLRNNLPSLLPFLDSGSMNMEIFGALAGDPQVQALSTVAEPFCAPCQSSLAETEECAVFVPLASSTCCVADFVSSGCAAVIAELPQGGGEVNDTALGMAMMPESVKALAEAFSDEDGAESLTTEQRVAKLEEVSISRLAQLVTVPLTSWCDMVKPGSPMMQTLECSQKLGMCVSSLSNNMSVPGDEQGDTIGSLEGILPAGTAEMCTKIESSCFQTTVDVCLGGSLHDLFTMVGEFDGMQEVPGEARRLLEEEGEMGDVVAIVGELFAGITQEVMPQLLSGNGNTALLRRMLGPLCTSACKSRLSSCEAAAVIPGLADLVGPNSMLSVLCGMVSAPLFDFGDRQRAVRLSSTLGLASVEDFSDSLRLEFLRKLAKAANVPPSQVNITSVKAGSVIVDSAVLVKAETDTAVEAYVADLKAALATPTAVFDREEFGDVTVKVTETVAVQPGDECPLCGEEQEEEQEDEGSAAIHSASAAAAALSIVAAAAMLLV